MASRGHQVNTEGEALGVGLERAGSKKWLRAVWIRGTSEIPSPVQAGDEGDPSPVGSSESIQTLEWVRLYERGCSCIEQGNYHLAVSLLRRVTRRNPEHADAWHKLGFAYGNLKRHLDALECCERAIEIEPRWVEAWCNHGWNQIQCKAYLQAMNDFNAAIEFDSTSANAWCGIGVANLRLKQYDQAKLSFENGSVFEDRDEDIWMGLARCHLALGNRQDAINCLRKVGTLGVKKPLPWLVLHFRTLSFPESQSAIRSKVAESVKLLNPSETNLGRLIEKDPFSVDSIEALHVKWITVLWQWLQNPVAWILIFVLASLLYILLGK